GREMRITARMLERKGACEEQWAWFCLYFGRSAEVTLQNCYEAAALGLNLSWAAFFLFPQQPWRKFDRAMDRIRKAVWGKFDRACALTGEEEGRRAVASVWDGFLRATAMAFYRAATGKEG
ncbi:MAG: hypothetical protein ABIL09_14340, partial [Gemmatimonadota bacterium]